jgi:predicted NACHT family NTPase
MVEDSSGLLVQKESGIYGFIHLTFQEYMASVHIKEERLLTELISRCTKLGGMRLRDVPLRLTPHRTL